MTIPTIETGTTWVTANSTSVVVTPPAGVMAAVLMESMVVIESPKTAIEIMGITDKIPDYTTKTDPVRGGPAEFVEYCELFSIKTGSFTTHTYLTYPAP